MVWADILNLGVFIMMSDKLLIEKLFEISGPILRWRITNELMDDTQYNKNELLEEAVNHKEAQKYIKYLEDGSTYGKSYNYRKMIHGCKPELLENTAYKLWAYGLGKGVRDIDNCFPSYADIIEYDFHQSKKRVGYGIFQMANLLGLIGFADESTIYSKLKKRLNCNRQAVMHSLWQIILHTFSNHFHYTSKICFLLANL